MASQKGKMKTIENYEPVVPLDYLILELLPIQGSMNFGVYPNGALATEIQPKIADGKLSMETITTRLRVLHLAEWIIPAKGLSSRNVWQRTPKGDKLLKEWRGSHGNGN